jgi:hypothetical protein
LTEERKAAGEFAPPSTTLTGAALGLHRRETSGSIEEEAADDHAQNQGGDGQAGG